MYTRIPEGHGPAHPDGFYPSDDVTRPCRIMVAYDGSAPARHALEVATRMAEKSRGTLILVNVVPPATGNGGEYVCSLEWLDAVRYRAAGEVLDQLRRSLPASIAVQQVVRRGVPKDEVVAAAEECKADLIVMGTSARGRIVQLLRGSTAEEVIRRAACPVVTVGPRAARGDLDVTGPMGDGEATQRSLS
jgi:nucleotide-binding universal stress UspA family protein